MSESTSPVDAEGPRHRTVEIGVALAMAAFGLIVMAGSLQVGINWGPEGPKSGFFPFYIGAMILLSSMINLALILTGGPNGKLFAEWGQLRQVLAVVIPTAVYVFVVPELGIYVSSLVLIAFFMIWLGGYSWHTTAAVSFGVMLTTYVVFEKWFLVPLPKGPVEDLLANTLGWG